MINMNNENMIVVVAQAFYGNRTVTKIDKNDIDRFILGYTGNDIRATEPIDRTIINIPNTDGIVLIYNKYMEEKRKEYKDEVLKNDNYVIKPVAYVPEKNIEIYSKCIASKVNEDGDFVSLVNSDYVKLENYLAD